MQNNHQNIPCIWVFQGEKAHFPSAVFDDKIKAFEWIESHQLSGVLTWYPLNISVYDWAIQQGCFTPKNEFQKESKMIANFSSAYQIHYHFENGKI